MVGFVIGLIEPDHTGTHYDRWRLRLNTGAVTPPTFNG